jgi:hypothetical protein
MTNEERIYELCGILIELIDMLPDNTTCNGLEWAQKELDNIRQDIDNS